MNWINPLRPKIQSCEKIKKKTIVDLVKNLTFVSKLQDFHTYILYMYI